MPLFVLPYPAIDPVLVELGPFAIRWYALAYIVGILLAWRYMTRLVHNDRLWQATPRPSAADIDDFVLWATFGIVLGGRLGYVLIYNLPYFMEHPAEIFHVWQGGMSFHGGFLGTVVAMVVFARLRKVPMLTLFDLAGTAAPIGLFFGRIANFINGELWGRVTDVPWAMVFPGAGPLPRHPSQLYEATLEGIVLFLVMRLLSHRFAMLQKPGFIAGAFAASYGIARLIGERFRMPDEQIGFLSFGTTMGMQLSLPMIVAGAALMLWAIRRRPTPDNRAKERKA
ncbi:prolipoprotein diacylglyceryl transferase [Breoghania corrubedonensis]|uniref:Phosphatidylglycerol--prolipoprotein diacylglyceryl transferase n=1 Tax=Breoghania corrubedonensis TaxID=665038 RepID=A0A2T5UNW1_9HYPH|nr:prolipoprotein diacylglyceryl transferase [Breoghania corrubedonensis]PTW53194.1 prolipoprotein diacylglyceryl transferase [Breoghania corrubedonensis]